MEVIIFVLIFGCMVSITMSLNRISEDLNDIRDTLSKILEHFEDSP